MPQALQPCIILFPFRRQNQRAEAYHDQAMRDPLQDRKVAMLYQLNPDSPEWDHCSKTLDSEDILLQPGSPRRACMVPYCEQKTRPGLTGTLPMPLPGGGDRAGPRAGSRAGPGDMAYTGTETLKSNNRHHVYEYPQFSS